MLLFRLADVSGCLPAGMPASFLMPCSEDTLDRLLLVRLALLASLLLAVVMLVDVLLLIKVQLALEVAICSSTMHMLLSSMGCCWAQSKDYREK